MALSNPFPPALGTVSHQAQANSRDLKIVLLTQTLYQLLAEGALEFDHLAIAPTDQVMVVFPLGLVVITSVAHVEFLDQSRLLQHAKGAIDGGETQARAFRLARRQISSAARCPSLSLKISKMKHSLRSDTHSCLAQHLLGLGHVLPTP